MQIDSVYILLAFEFLTPQSCRNSPRRRLLSLRRDQELFGRQRRTHLVRRRKNRHEMPRTSALRQARPAHQVQPQLRRQHSLHPQLHRSTQPVDHSSDHLPRKKTRRRTSSRANGDRSTLRQRRISQRMSRTLVCYAQLQHLYIQRPQIV